MDGISLTFPAKGLIALLGKSGSGKSTLLNLLSSSDKASKGSIFYNGKDISKLTRKETESLRRNEFGFVHQNIYLIDSLSVIENIAIPMMIRGKRKKTAFKEGKEFLKKFDLIHLKERKIRSLSGGERQRIALIRAISNNPRVIFADEPTGALDSKHGIEVMEALKEISKEKLVILVSHNEELVNQYADYIVRLSDGRVVESSLSKEVTKKEKIKMVSSTNKAWRSILLRKHLFENKKKNIFSVLATLLGCLTLVTSIGFFNGSNIASKTETKRLLTRFGAGISRQEEVELEDSPLSLIRVYKPSTYEISNIVTENIIIKDDYSYFFPRVNTIKVNKLEKGEFQIVPEMLKISDTYKSFLVTEEYRNKGENACLVNTEFVSETGCNIGDVLEVSHQITLLRNEHKEIVSINYEFYVSGIIKEFSFLNEPRIYYDYDLIFDYLSNYETDEGPSLMDLIKEANGYDPISSFQYCLFAFSEEGVKDIENLNTKEGWSLNAPGLSIRESFENLQTAVTVSIAPFLIMDVAMIAFVIGFISYSAFLERRKEAAIFNSLGASNRAVISVYCLEATFLCLLGGALSLILSFPLSNLLNDFLASRVMLNDLIRIPYLSPLLPVFIIVICLIGYFGTLIPLSRVYKGSVAEGLRE